MPWKSLGNKEGWWEICHFTSTQKTNISSPALAYLEKKYNKRWGRPSIGWRGSWGTELVWGNKGLFSKLSKKLKKNMPSHLVLPGSIPLKWGRQLFAVAPSMAQQWANAPSFVSGGWGGGGTSLQWRHPCHSTACCQHTMQAPPKLIFAKRCNRSWGGRASMGWQGSWVPEWCGGIKGCLVNWTVVVKN